jgi:hypothetical protein
LECLILRTLLRKFSFCLGALVLGPLLALVLLRGEQEADNDESKRDHEQIQPVPDCHPTEASPTARRAADGEQDDNRRYAHAYRYKRQIPLF